MANSDLLQTFLQLHLASDAAALSNLPFVIDSLSSTNIESSPHLAKWTTRVNSLIHSREPGARWAGITLALHTSRLSRSILISNAQNWVSVILPMLSRNESLAIWKASIRLIALIFTSTANLAEFQRHVVTPNLPKFSVAVLSLAEKQPEEELRVLCLDTLATMVSSYPSLHRHMSSNISTVTLNFLNGSHTLTPTAIVTSASRLHACLHVTGGKVGAAALWRRSLDETIVFCSSALASLRSTYVSENQFVPPQGDPLIVIPLNLDRLYCGVELLCHLLRAKVERLIPVPIHALVNLCVGMLKVIKDGQIREDIDPFLRSMEVSASANILELGCSLTACLAKCVQTRLAPHLARILGTLVYQLEQPLSKRERISILKLLPTLLGSCLPPHEPLICGRIIKCILPTIADLLSEKAAQETVEPTGTGSKKGKKRAGGYEGDEVFKVGRGILCETVEDAEHVFAALEALPYLLRVPKIPAYLQSLSSRLLLSLLLLVPKLSANTVAHDPTVKGKILRKVKETCIEITGNSSTALCKSLPLVVSATAEEVSDTFDTSNQDKLLVDLMLHPRLPPLLRSLPTLDSVALWQSEEGTEEQNTRESLRLRTANGDVDTGEDRDMGVDAQQIVRPEDAPIPVQPAAQQPEAPTVLPAVKMPPAAPAVVQPARPVPSLSEQTPLLNTGSPVPRINGEPEPPSSPKVNQQEERRLQMVTPEPHREDQFVQQQAQPDNEVTGYSKDEGIVAPNPWHENPPVQQEYLNREPFGMAVDDSEDEDIEMPVLDPASPTDSEVESDKPCML